MEFFKRGGESGGWARGAWQVKGGVQNKNKYITNIEQKIFYVFNRSLYL